MVSEKETSEKKRRKTSTTDSSGLKPSKEDLYESIITHEEQEAQKRSADKDMALFHHTCVELKTIFEEISTLKKDTTEKSKQEISEKRIQGSLIFVILKKLNRLDKVRIRAGRDALHKEKLRVDSNRLQLQNLLYEANHLKREVQRCYQFKSQDEEIDLVPVEEFYESAPDTISRPDKTKNDDHARRLAQLEWELQQRKELSSLCKELTVSKESVSKDISLKTERLDSLAPCLEALLKSTRPLQTALDMDIEKEWEVQKSARLLPRPLYLVYANLSAYAEACDKNLTATINGDEDEAKQLLEDDDKKEESQDDEDINNQESDNDDGDAENRKNHHKRLSKSDTFDAKKKNLLKVHPLSVTFTLTKSKPLKAMISITIHYFPSLGFVTAKPKIQAENVGVAAGDVISSENILNCLCDDDLGDKSPNPKTKYQLTTYSMNEENLMSILTEKDYGKPYKWVQKLCGFDFNTSIRPSTSHTNSENSIISHELAQNSVPTIIKLIQSRWNSRLCLFKQIHALENKNIDLIKNFDHSNLENKEYRNDLISTIRITSCLVQWAPIDWNEYSTVNITQSFIDENLVTLHDLYYRAIITRGSAKLECLICVSANFPIKTPLWCLCLSWNGKHDAANNPAIRQMEYWINSIKTTKKISSTILSLQLRRTMSSLDIFLETEGPNYSPAEFTQDKTFFKAFRGRQRSRPYKSVQNGGSVIFKQI